MNKYKFRLPYDFVKSGEVVGYIYAVDLEEAAERLNNCVYWVEEDHIDRYDGDTNYDYSDAEIEEDEEDVEYNYGFNESDNYYNSPISASSVKNKFPDYFLAELHLV